MNKQRRERINGLMAKLEEIQGEVRMIQEEEQEAFDNMPESIQTSERGEKMEEVITQLEDSDSNLDEARTILEEILTA